MATQPTFETRSGPERRGSKYDDVATFMRENPGTWVKVRTAPTEAAAWSAAQQIKAGRRAAFRPAADFETYTTGRDVVSRYVGTAASCPECHDAALPEGAYCPACGKNNYPEGA
jgi:hypothetical protein